MRNYYDLIDIEERCHSTSFYPDMDDPSFRKHRIGWLTQEMLEAARAKEVMQHHRFTRAEFNELLRDAIRSVQGPHQTQANRLTELLLTGHSWKQLRTIMGISMDEMRAIHDDALERAFKMMETACQEYTQKHGPAWADDRTRYRRAHP